jgi:16S rRNA pseudouridine516 synthase
MQIERILHSQGFGTRKECRALVRAGYVRIAGEELEDPFADIATAGLVLEVDGEFWPYHERAYLMLHKPSGFECSQKPQFHPSVYKLLPDPLVCRGVQSVGRLDEDTSGLLLFSDDGQFIHVWSSGKKRIPKVYELTTKHPVEAALIERLLAGVELHDELIPVAAAACEQTAEHGLRLTVTEGKYHQVKRMVAAAGNRVEALHRSQVGGLALPADLPPGEWRWLEAADLARLAEFSAPG